MLFSLPWGTLLEAFGALTSVLGLPRREIGAIWGGSAFEMLFRMVFSAILDRSWTSKTSISRERGLKNHVFS